MRKQSNEDRAIIDLINAFSEMCPTQFDKDAIRELVNNMTKEREKKSTIVLAITNRLHDGLAYGNWPSAIKQMEASA
jgi:hypothetical protein